MIGKIRTVVIGVTIEWCFSQSGPWKTDDITISILICHIHHHNDAIGLALFVPTMEGDEFGLIVEMIDMDVFTAQPPRHA